MTAFDQALGLWRGSPLAGVPGPFAEAQRARLDELRLAAVEERAEAVLRLDRCADVVRDLVGVVEELPTREQMCGLLVIALQRLGRRGEALAAYERTRAALAHDLGIEPGPQLRAVHERVVADAGDVWIPGDRRASGAAEPRHLPHDVPGFTGRGDELRHLRSLVPGMGNASDEDVPIVTIDGAGGTGKSALAVHFAHEVADLFPDGQLFVDLRGFGPAGPPLTAANALNRLLTALTGDVRRLPAHQDEQVALYRSLVAGRRLLVVLDNAVSAEQVRPLLPGAAGSMVLVTSRMRLAGLVARDGAHRINIGSLTSSESRGLLVFGLGEEVVAAEDDAAAALAELCGHLPLALRIVVERAVMRPHLTLAELVDDVRDATSRLDVLRSPDDELSAVRAVFSWSHDALDPAQARLFRLLGLHPGGEFGIDSVAALAGLPVPQAKRLTGGLLAAHLLEATARDRYRFHDLLGIYARECAQEHDPADRAAALDRVLAWHIRAAACANTVIGRVPADFGDPGVTVDAPLPEFASAADAIAWCARELPTLVDAIRFAESSGRDWAAWRIAVVLGSFFHRTNHLVEAVECTTLGLAAARRSGERMAVAWLHGNLGNAHLDLRELAEAREHHLAAVAAHEEVDDRPGCARAQLNLAVVEKNLGNHEEAVRRHRIAASLFAAPGDRSGEGAALSNLGEVLVVLGRHEEAAANHLRAVELSRGAGNPRVEGYCLGNLGESYRRLGRRHEAELRYHEALAAFRRSGDRLGEALCLVALSKVLPGTTAEGALTDAVGVLRELDGRQVAVAQSLLESLNRER